MDWTQSWWTILPTLWNYFGKFDYGCGNFWRKNSSAWCSTFECICSCAKVGYTLSTKLKKEAIQNCIGKPDEVKLIKFLTRYGYATRAQPFCRLKCIGQETCETRVDYSTLVELWHARGCNWGEKRKLSVTKLLDTLVRDRQRMVCHGPRGSLRGEPS